MASSIITVGGLSLDIHTAAQREKLVVKHMSYVTITAFLKDVLARIPEPPDDDEFEVNGLPGLLTNVLNNTPQPDRGGRTANQLAREHG